jgi:hypothetical protein
MKIVLKPVFYESGAFPHFHDFDEMCSEIEVSFKEEEKKLPLTKACFALVDAMNKHFSKKDISVFDSRFLEVCGDEIEIPSEVEISVIFSTEPILFKLDNVPVLGFHAISDAGFEGLEDTGYASEHRAFVHVDSQKLIEHSASERVQESDIDSDRYDGEYVQAVLTTVSHEVFHAIHLIRNCAGLPPSEIQSYFDPYAEDGACIDSWAECRASFEDAVLDLNDDAFPDFDSFECAVSEYEEEVVEQQGRDMIAHCLRDDDFWRAYAELVEWTSKHINKELKSSKRKSISMDV